MMPLEGAGAGLAAKAAVAAGKRFFRSTEFDRLCERLSERFEGLVPYTAADYASWAESANFAAAIGALLAPPHTVDREVLVSSITELVGALDDERGPEVFAGLVADALREEIRMSKTGDALVRLEADLTRQTIIEHERTSSVEAFERQIASAMSVSEWSPKLLGVHAAVRGRSSAGDDRVGFVLPEYVERGHDGQLRAHLKRIARSTARELLLIRGTSCSGKTRSAYEAVQVCLAEWSLVRPLDSASVAALGRTRDLTERTVVWLDDIHAFFDVEHAADVATALRHALEGPGPVVLLATIWHEAYNRLTDREADAEAARSVTALFRTATVIDVPSSFSERTLDEARQLATTDASLRTVLRTANDGAICQTLAAGPELVARWAQGEDPYTSALITAAIDARRLRLPRELPLALLRDAVPGYLDDDQRADAPPDWFERAVERAGRKVQGVIAPLGRVPIDDDVGAEPGLVRLADYLEHEGRRLRTDEIPPEALWNAALHHTQDAGACAALAFTAEHMGYRRIALLLRERAARAGHSRAMHDLWTHFHRNGDDDAGLPWLIRAMRAGNSQAVQSYEFWLGQTGGDLSAAIPYWTVAAENDDTFAIGRLAHLLERLDRHEEALGWWWRGHALAYSYCSDALAGRLFEAGDLDSAEAIWTDLARRGEDVALWELLALKCLRGHSQEELRETWEQGVANGCTWGWVWGAGTRMTEEGHEAAKDLPVWGWLHELADAGDTRAMRLIADALLPDPDDYENDYRPPDEDITYARRWLSRAANAGDPEAGKRLARAPRPRLELEHAAASGDRDAMTELAVVLEDEGEFAAAEAWWRHAVESGSTWAPKWLAAVLDRQGKSILEDETLLRAAEDQSAEALLALAKAHEAQGNREEAERLLRRYDGADHDYRLPLVEFLARQGDPRHLEEAERRLRAFVQRGSPWLGEDDRAEELLAKLLRDSGRAQEADRFLRLGLEPDGRTAQAR
jgi:hypothetical protein